MCMYVCVCVCVCHMRSILARMQVRDVKHMQVREPTQTSTRWSSDTDKSPKTNKTQENRRQMRPVCRGAARAWPTYDVKLIK
jgi:hypothetical protein